MLPQGNAVLGHRGHVINRFFLLFVSLVLVLTWIVPAALRGPTTAGTAHAGGGAAREAAPAGVRAFLDRHCVSCHEGSEAAGDFDAVALDPEAQDQTSLHALLAIRDRVATGEMPPPEMDPPAPQEIGALLTAIDRRLEVGVPALEADPGRVVLRRLSREEYRRTVRDLLGLDFNPSDRFPTDDLAYGFDNIGGALTISPLLLEKYAEAAQEIAARTISLEDPDNPRVRRFEAESMDCTLGENQGVHGSIRNLYSNAEVTARVRLPRDGEYLIRAGVFGQQAGPDPARMAFLADGRQVEAVDVPESGPELATKEHRLRLSEGSHVLGIGFINDYYQPDATDPSQRDRNLVVDYVEVVGPLDRLPLSKGHAWLFALDKQKGKPGRRAKPLLEALVSRAWRRKGKPSEIRRLQQLVETVVEDEQGHFVEGVQRALAAVLVSPHFLFRLEPGAKVGKGRVADLKDEAMAVRLSYFLWSSLPDEALFEAARRRRLRTSEGLLAEARRMLADPKAEALASNFCVQWLELRSLEHVEPDPERFPGFTDTLRHSMRREAELFFYAVLREGLDVRTLLDADFSYVDRHLAAHYGLAPIEGDGFVRVALPDKRRGGILTQAGVLTVTSNPTRTSPVKRGKWVLLQILDQAPPPPPPGADNLDEEAVVQSASTLREHLAQHRERVECASCHVRMDALGLAFENYDAVGRWREQHGGKAIDASGTLPGGVQIADARALKPLLARDVAYLRCLLGKLFTYAVGRPPAAYDDLVIFDAARRMASRQVTLEELILTIVQMDAFRKRAAGE